LREINLSVPAGKITVLKGPSGSGKTTTLYAALSEINSAETKIITAEDPVEYLLPRINQVQIHEKIGLTFPTVLRTALRQDPDVILIGEMRDQETVEIGLRAAMTGHLVFSTLHTNDAISTVSRLLDMGAESFLLASSLRAVMAQRLVRRLCPECHKPHTLDEQEQHWLSQLLDSPEQLPDLHQAVGCQQCKNTGYKGRVGVYELLVMTAELTDALQQGNNTSFIALATQQQRNKTLASNAVELAKQGITSLDEIIRIASDLDVNVPATTVE